MYKWHKTGIIYSHKLNGIRHGLLQNPTATTQLTVATLNGLSVLYLVFQDDEVFTFNFNVIATHEGKEVTHALNKTCSPSLPWSPREVTCELNYMEVSLGISLMFNSGCANVFSSWFSTGVCKE